MRSCTTRRLRLSFARKGCVKRSCDLQCSSSNLTRLVAAGRHGPVGLLRLDASVVLTTRPLLAMHMESLVHSSNDLHSAHARPQGNELVEDRSLDCRCHACSACLSGDVLLHVVTLDSIAYTRLPSCSCYWLLLLLRLACHGLLHGTLKLLNLPLYPLFPTNQNSALLLEDLDSLGRIVSGGGIGQRKVDVQSEIESHSRCRRTRVSSASRYTKL